MGALGFALWISTIVSTTVFAIFSRSWLIVVCGGVRKGETYSSSKEKQIVLDPFLGSGTTAVACKQLNRKCLGIEISKEYCDIANKRLQQGVL